MNRILDNLFRLLARGQSRGRKALVAASLGWMLDAFDVMLYALILTAVSQDLGLTRQTGGLMASLTLGASAVGGPAVWRPGRQTRPHAGPEPQHPALFGLYVRLRLRAERLAVRHLPHLPRPGHGRRMGQRRHPRQRDLAGEAPRQGARHHAKLLGHRLRPRRHRRRDRAAAFRLARGVLRRHHPRDLHAVDSPQREGTRDVARIPARSDAERQDVSPRRH